ncbi:MAG: translation initiation factor IF-3 [Mycoplasmataceae bacterium]|jgi:translation initiation factor IF-3|nr:translation initiation factor IF-3 [Mycoplasmataceae bacterium]
MFVSQYIFDNDIKDDKIFLIDEDGTKFPNIELSQALKIAKDKKKNIVLIVPAKEKSLSICRVVDKQKFLFEAKKKEKEKQKNLNSVQKLKEVSIRSKIGKADLERYIKNTISWVENNNQVKIKIDAKNDISEISREEIKQISRKLDKDEFNKKRLEILNNNSHLIDNIVQKLYEKIISGLSEKVKITQPLKRVNNTTFITIFSPLNRK